jgi:hypothetical protein
MSDERGTMSDGHDRMAGLVETMMTADSLQLTAYGPDDGIRIVEDLPKAKPPRDRAASSRSGRAARWDGAMNRTVALRI